jgi:sterol desaturase/sphingolipid hydroxylase (fatty acid hydroxylase superfamily)
MNHHVPMLWFFHRVHHLDRDLDVSTGVRFHPGEMALSSFFRAAQVRILGVDERTLRIWQRMLLISILFHHSNLRLPEKSDRVLTNAIVTPRMHGIHHSDREEETNSNYSSLFTIWDRLHGTLRLDRPQEEITIGAP